MSGRPAGSHKFLGHIVCDFCGLKETWGRAGFARMRNHLSVVHQFPHPESRP